MSVLRKFAVGLVVLLLLIAGVVAWMFRSRAEEIPDELPPIDAAEADPQKLVIPGSAGLPDLKLADYRGKTLYLAVEDRESNESGEGKAVSRATAQWTYPEGVTGFVVVDVEGFGMFASKVEEYAKYFRPEVRLPLYFDFEGAVTKTFKLPKGHAGMVVLGPEGKVTFRHSGPMDPAKLEELRKALGATMPERAPAPAFKIGPLDNAACEGRACVLVFLAGPVARKDIPRIKDGFDGDLEAQAVQSQKPDVRLASLVVEGEDKLDLARVAPLVIGRLDGVELKKWQQVDAAPEARAAFGIPEGETGLVVIDPEGKLAMKELGRVQFYKFGLLSDLVGVELGKPDEPKP